MTTYYTGLLHPDSCDFFSIVNSRQDGHVGVAFAATRTTYLTKPGQRTSGHNVRVSPCLIHQRGRTGDDGDEHTRAYGCTAGSPESACSARYLAAAAYHLAESLCQVNLTSGIMIGSQESCTDHDVMFRSMHMAE